jgi:hypothetical protein
MIKIWRKNLSICGSGYKFLGRLFKIRRWPICNYGDAIHEGSGKDKNPILSLGLLRNLLDLVIDLSASLKTDENRQAKWKDILSKLSEFPVQTRNGRKVFRYTRRRC